MAIIISGKEIKNTLAIARGKDIYAAAEALYKLGILRCAEAAPTLRRRAKDTAPQVRVACVRAAIGVMGANAVNYLAGFLEDKVVEIGVAAATQLAKAGTRQAAEILIETARNENWLINQNACCGLEFWNSKEGVEPLLAAVANPMFRYRIAAALALKQSGSKTVPEEVVREYDLQDDEWKVTQLAAILTLLGDDHRVVVRNALEACESAVKLSALYYLGILQDKEAFLDIVPLLKDEDPAVVARANETLRQLGLTQKEKGQGIPTEQAKNNLRKTLPEGYQLDADE